MAISERIRFHGLPGAGKSYAVAIAAAFALTLQVQLNIDAPGSPVRLAASDPLLLIAAPFLLSLLVRHWSALSSRRWPFWSWALVLATAIVTLGFALGVMRLGLTGWAVGKYAGWFVLLGYGFCGFMSGFAAPSRAPAAAACAFAIGLGMTVAANVVLNAFGRLWPVSGDQRFSGFLDNPNATGLLLLCAIAMILRRCSRGWRWTVAGGMLVAGILFSQSIAALCGLAAMMLVFLLLRRDWRGAIFTIALGVAVFAGATAMNSALYSLGARSGVQGVRITDKLESFATSENVGRPAMFTNSVPSRIESAKRAIGVWKDHPLFGAGIGAYFAARQAKAAPDAPAMIIHSTPLWLLTAFGLAGFTIMASLFASFSWWLVRALPEDEAVAGLLIVSSWAVTALAHEMLYQRAPWFALGLCAGALFARSARDRGPDSATASPV